MASSGAEPGCLVLISDWHLMSAQGPTAAENRTYPEVAEGPINDIMPAHGHQNNARVPAIRTTDQSSLNAVLRNILTAVVAASVAMGSWPRCGPCTTQVSL